MMDSVRRGLYGLALESNRRVSAESRFFYQHQWDSPKEVQAIQHERLSRLLRYACEHVPYYRRLFEAAGVSRNSGVASDTFMHIPTLSRALVREHFEALKSDDLSGRPWFENRTSGSTGEPLVLIQDRNDIQVSGGAVLRWFYGWHGIRPGDREIKLWGSDRDLFYGAPPLRQRIRGRFQGIRLLNAFTMTPATMERYVRVINEYRPAVLRGYSSNLFELAAFAQERRFTIVPPKVVISSAGKLYKEMRETMESSYGCAVVDHYGTRELHNVAMECERRDGLHVSAFTHLVEILDDQGLPCGPGEEGDLVVTPLTNLAMPLIRYHIGDRGALSEMSCPCGRGLPVLKAITGRRVDCFRTRDGRLIPGEFFIYLLGVMLKDNPFSRVQVIQEGFESILVNAVLREGRRLDENTCREVTEKSRVVMGSDCAVRFELVKDIPPLPSGKYPYTVSRVTEHAWDREAPRAPEREA